VRPTGHATFSPDASVLIAYLDAEDAQHQAAESMLARAVDDEFAANPAGDRGCRVAISCRHRCAARPVAGR
jgi:hypothetical protein